MEKIVCLGFLCTSCQISQTFLGTKEETGFINSQIYHWITISGLHDSFKIRLKKKPRWLNLIIFGIDLQGICKLRSRNETRKGHTDNRPLKSTRPCPDRIGNINGRSCLCCFFLRNATLQLHQEVNNSRKLKNKYHYTWKHPILLE